MKGENTCLQLVSFTVIADGELWEGEFPKRAKKMVKEFINKYEKELLEMWETEQYVKLEGIE